MRKIISLLLRNRRLHDYLRQLYHSSVERETELFTSIPEITSLRIKPSDFSEKRLNLLVPALSEEHIFGGINTALEFYKALGMGQDNLRIVLTEESVFAHENNMAYSEWEITDMETSDKEGRLIVPCGDRSLKALPVSSSDYFVATAWWTAFIVREIVSQQAELYGESNRFVYLIQDYEPGFYPWSTRYALAESTYHDSTKCVAVFNSHILRDYFDQEGYKYASAFYFEPVLNDKLKPFLKKIETTRKEKKVLVYGRPSVSRNAFELIVMGLRMWIDSNESNDWIFRSAGEYHQPIELGCGKELVSLGKLSLDGYADELLTSYAGISLMISPHPSYPPLEMAAFGVKVITNKYEPKDLSEFSKNITSLDALTPHQVAEALDKLCSEFNSKTLHDHDNTDAMAYYKNSDAPFSEISGKILKIMYGDENPNYQND